MEVKVEDGFLTVKLPLEPPTPSKSKKTLVVASTRGNVLTTATINGEPVTVGVNAYIRQAVKK